MEQYKEQFQAWQNDWNKFAYEVLKASLDRDQQKILSAIQTDRRVSVRSGTSRGKDHVAAVASLCFLYLTPRMVEGELVENTKVINTAPTGRQIRNIMIPEITRLFNKAKVLPGTILADGIRFEEYKEWFLTGFKASDTNIEAWSGLHAANIMVVVSEASGLSDVAFDSIEGILHGNSRLLMVFNPNVAVGAAFKSTRSELYTKFKLNDLNAPNVVNYRRMLKGEITEDQYKQLYIPGQVDYQWISERLQLPGWVTEINREEFDESKYDFEWEGHYYRPGDLFRIKVLGEFASEGDSALIPLYWIEEAFRRFSEMEGHVRNQIKNSQKLKIGQDVAGLGRDDSVKIERYGSLVDSIETMANDSKDQTIHMQIAGILKSRLDQDRQLKQMDNYAFVDTIGEGAGVQSRLVEQGYNNAVSTKFSENATGLKDETGYLEFQNMRAYLFWKVREALNPNSDQPLAIPYNSKLLEEATSVIWKFNSNGKIQIESKEEITKRLGRSPDILDALANTFYPEMRIIQSDNEGIFSYDLQDGVL